MTIDLGQHIERVARVLLGEPNRALSKGDELRFGRNGSTAVMIGGPKAGTWYDHEHQRGGGFWDFLYVYGEMDREEAEDWLARQGIGDTTTIKQRIVTTYSYVNEAGALLFQVHRWGPKKTFSQSQPGSAKGGIKRKPDGKPDMSGVRYVPYRLNELVAEARGANGDLWRILIVEGEKDVDRLRLWGIFATTCPMGAGKWRADYNRFFAGADVIVIPDNDDAGRKHALDVANALFDVAPQIRIVELTGLPEKGDISDWIAAGGTQSDLETLIETSEPFAPSPDDDDEHLEPPGQPEVRWAGSDQGPIPPRQWLLGTNFCRGFLSGLTGAGAAGKTAIRVLQYMALALDRGDLVGEHVFKRTKVLLVCLEDDETELRRRIRAACIHYRINESELNGWLAYWTPRDLHLLDVDQFGNAQPGGLGDALRRIITGLGIGLVGVDPFIKSHGAEENDNSAIDKAASLFLQVAYDCGCACDYVHHNRKGVILAGDPDAARGASALVNASRLVKTATKMSAAEAEKLDVSPSDRQRLVRLDDAKLNIAPPAEQTVWFRLIGVDIGNATTEYPSGDNVQTVERWYPLDIWTVVTPALANRILDQIEQGPAPGRRYSAAAHAKRAAWPTVQEFCPNLTRDQAQKVVATWVETGVLISAAYDDPQDRKSYQGLSVGKRPGDTWSG